MRLRAVVAVSGAPLATLAGNLNLYHRVRATERRAVRAAKCGH